MFLEDITNYKNSKHKDIEIKIVTLTDQFALRKMKI